MAAYTCDKCGHMMLDDQLREEAMHSMLVADLRKLVEELKDVQDIYPGLHNVIAKIEKLLKGGD